MCDWRVVSANRVAGGRCLLARVLLSHDRSCVLHGMVLSLVLVLVVSVANWRSSKSASVILGLRSDSCAVSALAERPGISEHPVQVPWAFPLMDGGSDSPEPLTTSPSCLSGRCTGCLAIRRWIVGWTLPIVRAGGIPRLSSVTLSLECQYPSNSTVISECLPQHPVS